MATYLFTLLSGRYSNTDKTLYTITPELPGTKESSGPVITVLFDEKQRQRYTEQSTLYQTIRELFKRITSQTKSSIKINQIVVQENITTLSIESKSPRLTFSEETLEQEIEQWLNPVELPTGTLQTVQYIYNDTDETFQLKHIDIKYESKQKCQQLEENINSVVAIPNNQIRLTTNTNYPIEETIHNSTISERVQLHTQSSISNSNWNAENTQIDLNFGASGVYVRRKESYFSTII